MKTFENLHPKTKIKISIEEIIRIEADINYSHLILNTGKRIILARTLKSYEKDLNLPFLRVNRSCIINLLFLDNKINLDTQKIRLQDGFETQISRRRTQKVSKAIESISR